MSDLAEPLRQQLDKTPTLVLLRYLRERLGPKLVDAATARARRGEGLPTAARSLAESLAERVDVARGTWRLELEFKDGRLELVRRHEKVGALALDERFDRPLLAGELGHGPLDAGERSQ